MSRVNGQLRGVATIGRGARKDKPGIAVITRLCTDGCWNGCSQLYVKAKRLAQALGFVGLKTFTREDESGCSLFAAGAEKDGKTEARHWDRPSRPRERQEAVARVQWNLRGNRPMTELTRGGR